MRILIIVVITILVFQLSATIINIPANYSTIQEGINASVNGDTLLVQPGTYVENINYNGKNITIASLFLTTQDTTYIAQTVIDGNQNGSVVTFENQEDSTAVLTGFRITNGYGYGLYLGGGITCESETSPRILNALITDNESENKGGGIYCIDSSLYLKDVTIEFNASEYKGGGICCYSVNINLKNVNIANNVSQYGGGFCTVDSNPSFDNVTISDNYAYILGGGIYTDESNLIIENALIINNSAYHSGGGIACLSYSNLTLENVEIVNNFANSEGGGISSFNSNLNLENIEIINNSALYYGGGIYLNNSELDMHYCQLDNNNCGDYSTDGRGGALYIRETPTNLFQCDFLNNTANSHAGAIYLNSTSAFINKCSFVGNISEGNVGGLYFYKSDQLEIINSTFFNNIGTDSGAMRFYIETPPISIPIVKNTISWNNSPTEIFCSEDGYPNDLIISYSDIEGGEESIVTNNNANISWLEGNLNTDPVFVNPILGDIHLSENSPCIDAGDPTSILDPDGTFIDMGAFYYDQSVSVNGYEIQAGNYSLSNYPNPFNPTTTIEFSIQNYSKIDLSIYNIKGQKIKTLIKNDFDVGSHSITWNGDDESGKPVSSGIYCYKLNINGKTEAVKKCLLLK